MIIEMFDKKVDKAQVITFDIYDTLVLRNTKLPEEIFIRVGKSVLGEKNAKEFANKRILAERKARGKSIRDGEVCLHEIYEQMDYKPDVLQKLEECECTEEIKSVYQKTKIANLLASCVGRKKIVYLISDMYLPETIIKESLAKCEITGFSGLFISNEYGASKRKGKLFDIFLEETKVDPHAVLHIGDSYQADFKMPRQYGIDSIWIPQDDLIIRKARHYLFTRGLKDNS